MYCDQHINAIIENVSKNIISRCDNDEKLENFIKYISKIAFNKQGEYKDTIINSIDIDKEPTWAMNLIVML